MSRMQWPVIFNFFESGRYKCNYTELLNIFILKKSDIVDHL